MSGQIKISETIYLESITIEDASELYDLMEDIYPKAYDYFWVDNGDWYLNSLYNKSNIQTELNESNSIYSFIIVDNEKVGILRLLHDKTYAVYADEKSSKLHRMYLHPKSHGKGIAIILMNWVMEECRKAGSEMLWLDAMDTKAQALQFYKKMGFQIGSHEILPFERLKIENRGMYQMWRKI